MIRERYFGPLAGVCIALVYGALFVTSVWDVWSKIRTWQTVLIITALMLGLYFVGFWIEVRRAELKEKIPTPSKELRKRRKRFYDWLDSQGRR